MRWRVPVREGRALALALAAWLVNAEASAQAPESGLRWDEARPHHLSLPLGLTDNGEATAFTAGIDYEYRFGRRIGVGGVIEHAVADVSATTLLAVLDLHLWRGLALQTGPGIEWRAPPSAARSEEFVYRAGLLYEFELGAYTLAPQLHLDVVPAADEESWILLLAVGRAF
jgi:hypothetical protein